jgi:hypothetical protein
MAELAGRVFAKWQELAKSEKTRFNAKLQPGLEEAELVTLEKELNARLPESLRELYKLANGQDGDGEEYPTEVVGLFGDHLSFPACNGSVRSYTGDLENIVECMESLAAAYEESSSTIDDAPLGSKRPMGQSRMRKRPKHENLVLEINGTKLRYKNAHTVGCCLCEEDSYYYFLLIYEDVQTNEQVYDVVMFYEQEDYIPFGATAAQVEDNPEQYCAVLQGKPSATRFDEWLEAYLDHLNNHLDCFFESNAKDYYLGSLSTRIYGGDDSPPSFAAFHGSTFTKMKSANKA